MSSSSSGASRPDGNHRVPRKGARTLTRRVVRIDPDRRAEIDLHYLGQALLRLAQEQYDLERGTQQRPLTSHPGGAREAAHGAHRRPSGAPPGPRGGRARSAGPWRGGGATELPA